MNKGTMENNKSQFKRTGALHDGAECIEMQISHSGDAARHVSAIMLTVKDPEVTRDYRFEYMLLDRLQCDCDYYLGYGSRNAGHCLWAHDEQKQIDKMRELYDLLPVKPEWLTKERIDEYAARMGVK